MIARFEVARSALVAGVNLCSGQAPQISIHQRRWRHVNAVAHRPWFSVGGGAFGQPAALSKAAIERDIMRGYFVRDEALRRFGVAP